MTEELELTDGESEQELHEHYRFIVDKGQSLLRIDKFLQHRLENTSRNRVQNAAEEGCIHVNNKAVKSNYKVKPGDIITILLPHPPKEIELIPENIPLNIVYEDDHIVVVNKPANMVVHPAYGNYKGTLVNALAYHFQNLPQNAKSIDGAVKPGLVHRIDKNTTGIILIAKTEKAMTRLANDFFERNIDRKYIALVWGNFENDEGTIIGNVGRNPKDRKVMYVFPEGSEHGKHAVTHYKVLERFSYVTLVECKLETGRTHQIRVHFQSIGHPLFNDDTYGGNRILKGTTFAKYEQFVENCFKLLPRQALHAKSLGFTHPDTKKYVHFDSELPDDMKAVIEKWRTYSNSYKV